MTPATPNDPTAGTAGSQPATTDAAPAPSRRGQRRTPTRILLACAAIGAAGGLIVAPITIFSSTGPALALPVIYALLSMVKLLPGVLAQTLLRLPGVALLTGVIVGLINIPFSAHGPMVFVSLAGVGLLQEIVVAVLLYRRWGLLVQLINNLVAGAAIAWLGWRLFAADATHAGVAIGYWGAAIAAIIAVTLIGYLIAARVRRSGVAGLGDARDKNASEPEDELVDAFASSTSNETASDGAGETATADDAGGAAR